MGLPLVVRAMSASETSFVLSTWKKELRDHRGSFGWGKGLEERDFWALVNYVIDKITMPSCSVFVGCHEAEEDTPVCWVAVRKSEVLFSYARRSVLKNPELAASLERELLARLPWPAAKVKTFNPFLELRR